MTEESTSSRLARIEAIQIQQGGILERTATAVEGIAVISERMTNHIEDTKRMHGRIDVCENDIVALQTLIAEIHAFYRDMKRALFAILGATLIGVGSLIVFWVENH